MVITGGKGDLGREIQRAFEGMEWEVDAPGREELDVTDTGIVDSYFDSRPADLLVCCAGLVSDQLLPRLTEMDWDRVFRVNYLGASNAAYAAAPHMIRNGGGHIVFISSYSAVHPPPGQVAYAAAKAALIGLSADLAARLGTNNIRVNTILPGFMETRMTMGVGTERRAEVAAAHNLGRFNTPAAVAGFIRFLHEKLPHTSGQVFSLDSRPL